MKRMSASSLVEVTVAAAILVIVFALALAVCARLVRQGPTPRQLQARLLVQDRAMRTIRTKQLYFQTEEIGPILLEQAITSVPNHPYLYNLRVQAIAEDSVLATHQELVYSPPTDAH